jgi:hypothetical protein
LPVASSRFPEFLILTKVLPRAGIEVVELPSWKAAEDAATMTSFSGLASLPIIRADLVLSGQVLTDEQLNTAVIVSRATPGPVGIYVVSVGYAVAGLPGAIAGWAAICTPALLVVPLIHFASRQAAHRRVRGATHAVVAASAGLLIRGRRAACARSVDGHTDDRNRRRLCGPYIPQGEPVVARGGRQPGRLGHRDRGARMNAAVAVLLVLLSVNQSGPAHAQAPRRRLTVAAACDLKFAFEELNRQWSSQGI